MLGTVLYMKFLHLFISFFSPKFDLPVLEVKDGMKKLICHNCRESGHKAVNCPKAPNQWSSSQQGRQQTDRVSVNRFCSCVMGKYFPDLGAMTEKPGPDFKALLSAEFCSYNHHSLLTVQAPNSCSSCVKKECIVTRTWSRWSTHK